MYQIKEWRARYEVSFKGREPKDGEELRAGPLLYVRLKVYGHRQGAGYRRLHQLCGVRSLEVFGIFCKFLEISGNQPREQRGSLLNEKDAPATISDLAFIVGVTDEQASFAVDSLCQLGWISNDDITSSLKTTQYNSTQHNARVPARTRKRPRSSGKIRERPTNDSENASISDFDQFWAAYPKQKSKGDARKAWAQLKVSKALFGTILSKLAQLKTTPDWLKNDGQYVPYPATWLRADGWDDEVQTKETAAEKVARLKAAGLL